MALPERLPLDRLAAIRFYAETLAQAEQLDRETGGERRFRWNAERWLARNDLFYLLVAVCKRTDMNLDWIFARCREVQAEPNGCLDLWAREHYKAVALDEPVPTPAGWTRHGDLKPGDVVFGPDGKPCRVVARTKVFEDADCYRATFDDGYAVTVSGEHLWTVERKSRRRVKGEPGKRVYREEVTISTAEMAAHDHRQNDRLAIRVNDPLDLQAAPLPVDPYILGVWLGDGNLNAAAQVCALEDYEHFKAAYEAAGHTVSEAYRRGNCIGFRIDKRDRSRFCVRGHDRVAAGTYRNQCQECRRQRAEGTMGAIAVDTLAWRLRKLGVLNDGNATSRGGRKHIPPQYLRASAEQRRALLQGLMDTDGTVNPRGTAQFINTSAELADGVFELAASLGLKPRRRQYSNAFGPVYDVAFQAYAEDRPFRLARKLARCKDGQRCARRFVISVERVPAVPVSCIQVDRPDGLYLVGRHMATTHNSTVITFGLSLQDILASHGTEPEKRYQGREVTIGIFSHTRPAAKDFLKQIKRECEDNEHLRHLFPDVIWANAKVNAPKWSEDDGLIFKRRTNPKEATVEAWGLVDGQPTGKHYFIRVYDDIVTEKSVTTPEQIAKTTSSWEHSDNLGTSGGWERYIGTRYHHFDTYAEMMKRQVVKVRLHPCTADGSEDFSKAVLKPPDELAKKRQKQGPYTFGCQMLLNPTADKAKGFREEWLRYWPADNRANLTIGMIVDPASGKKGSDYTAIWVYGLGADGKRYVLDGVRDRLNLTGRGKAVMDLHRLWKPVKVGYEEYGLQADIEFIEFLQARENYRFDITKLGGGLRKQDRIERLVPVFERGDILLPKKLVKPTADGLAVDLIQAFVNEEYLAYPVLAHDDALDCLARSEDPEMALPLPKTKADESHDAWKAHARAAGPWR